MADAKLASEFVRALMAAIPEGATCCNICIRADGRIDFWVEGVHRGRDIRIAKLKCDWKHPGDPLPAPHEALKLEAWRHGHG